MVNEICKYPPTTSIPAESSRIGVDCLVIPETLENGRLWNLWQGYLSLTSVILIPAHLSTQGKERKEPRFWNGASVAYIDWVDYACMQLSHSTPGYRSTPSTKYKSGFKRRATPVSPEKNRDEAWIKSSVLHGLRLAL